MKRYFLPFVLTLNFIFGIILFIFFVLSAAINTNLSNLVQLLVFSLFSFSLVFICSNFLEFINHIKNNL